MIAGLVLAAAIGIVMFDPVRLLRSRVAVNIATVVTLAVIVFLLVKIRSGQ